VAASYLALFQSGELAERVRALEALLKSCTVCPLDCGNDRTQANWLVASRSLIRSFRPIRLTSEKKPPLVGKNGAGNIFFGNCNLRCGLLPELPDLSDAQRATQE
jgi:putative pyruvate formate lyase activating enzyme